VLTSRLDDLYQKSSKDTLDSNMINSITGNSNFSENLLSKIIIGLAIDVHRTLGPGLLESAYKECLYYKLGKEGLSVEKERPMPLIYENVKLDCGYRIDLLINKKVLIEIKSVEQLNDIHIAQTLTYLKLGGYKLGLLINFNVLLLKDGIKRLINGSL
jgi:GxxExxY protein